MSHHLVFGAGLIGGYLAGCLISAGVRTSLVAREKTQTTLADGISVSDFLGNSLEVSAPAFYDTNNSSIDPVDVVWLTVKCTSLEAIVDELRLVLQPHTTVICCQNGLGSVQILEKAFPQHCVLTALVGYNVAQPEPAHFHRSTDGELVIQQTELTEKLAKQIHSALLPTKTSQDIEASQWAKLQLNLTNPVNALADIPTKTMLETAGYRKIIASLMLELLSVAKSKGLSLPKLTPVPPAWIPRIMSLPDWAFGLVGQKMVAVDPTAKLSMWWDLSAGKKTEIEFLNGALVREADALGMDCPTNRSITRLIQATEAGSEQMGMDPQTLAAKMEQYT